MFWLLAKVAVSQALHAVARRRLDGRRKRDALRPEQKLKMQCHERDAVHFLLRNSIVVMRPRVPGRKNDAALAQGPAPTTWLL
jgi:hypothetical protein